MKSLENFPRPLLLILGTIIFGSLYLGHRFNSEPFLVATFKENRAEFEAIAAQLAKHPEIKNLRSIGDKSAMDQAPEVTELMAFLSKFKLDNMFKCGLVEDCSAPKFVEFSIDLCGIRFNYDRSDLVVDHEYLKVQSLGSSWYYFCRDWN